MFLEVFLEKRTSNKNNTWARSPKPQITYLKKKKQSVFMETFVKTAPLKTTHCKYPACLLVFHKCMFAYRRFHTFQQTKKRESSVSFLMRESVCFARYLPRERFHYSELYVLQDTCFMNDFPEWDLWGWRQNLSGHIIAVFSLTFKGVLSRFIIVLTLLRSLFQFSS